MSRETLDGEFMVPGKALFFSALFFEQFFKFDEVVNFGFIGNRYLEVEIRMKGRGRGGGARKALEQTI